MDGGNRGESGAGSSSRTQRPVMRLQAEAMPFGAGDDPAPVDSWQNHRLPCRLTSASPLPTARSPARPAPHGNPYLCAPQRPAQRAAATGQPKGYPSNRRSRHPLGTRGRIGRHGRGRGRIGRGPTEFPLPYEALKGMAERVSTVGGMYASFLTSRRLSWFVSIVASLLRQKSRRYEPKQDLFHINACPLP